jgi:chaperonin GroES
MNFTPIDDRVLVEPITEDEIKGSIIIPDTLKEKPVSGIVLAIGNDFDAVGKISLCKLIDIGDTVLFGKYAGQEVKDGVKKLMVINRSDILGVMGR